VVVAAVAVVTAAAGGPALGADPARRQAIQARIAALQRQVERTHAKAAVLRAQVATLSAQIRAVERQVGAATLRLAPIERELELREIKLNRLNAVYRYERDRLRFLRGQYRIASEHLRRRLIRIYESPPIDTLGIVLSATSFTDMLDELDYAKRLGQQDQIILREVATAKTRVEQAFARTRIARRFVLAEARAVAYRVRELRELRDQLLRHRGRLAGERAEREDRIDALSESERRENVEIRVLRQRDEALAGVIQHARSEYGGPVDSTVSSAGLIWPVEGPITSGFGPRWGSFHYGLDIAAGIGTPIHAAAAGVVIYAGWYGGFGNFVIVDHGDGIATTYGHQSRIAVSPGERVAQGQVIGYVGSTGFSTGPHLDFEVRLNGAPVDPLGYL